MRWVDCRKCKYFISYDTQQPGLTNVLGWCKVRDGSVTYYEGACRYFKSKYLSQESKRITDFIRK